MLERFVAAWRGSMAACALFGALTIVALFGAGCGGGSLSSGSTSTGTGTVTATAETSPSSIQVSWTASNLTNTQSFIAYNVYRNGSVVASLSGSTTSFTDLATTAAHSLTYTTVPSGSASQASTNTVSVSPVAVGSSYSYAVSVVYADNTIVGQQTYHEVEIGSSSTVTISTGATSVSATSTSTTAITVNWTAPTLAAQQSLVTYNVFRDGVAIASIAGTSTTYVDSTATAAHSLTYSTVISGTNTSLSSQTVNVTPVTASAGHVYTVTVVYLDATTSTITYHEVLLGTSSSVMLATSS